MKNMVASLKLCLLSLALLTQNIPAGTTIERDSFRFLLSRLFSVVERSGETGIEVSLMDAPVTWSICDCGNQNQFKYVEGGEKVRLAFGDCIHFCLAGLSVGMEVSLTNGAYRSAFIRIPDQFVNSGELIVFADRGCKIRMDVNEPEPCRWFVYDLARHELFDAQNGSFARFELPFRALWKSWDDYEENFSGGSRVDFMASARETAQFLRKRAEKSQTLRKFCQGQTNDAPCVVRYWTERFVTDLALVRRQRIGVEVLGVAEVEQGGRITAFMFDERGHLRWWSVHAWPDSKFAYIYEFDGTGAVRRFVELDSRGRELRRRFRMFKDGKMVAPELRSAFCAEAEAATRSLTEAWTNGSIAIVPNVPHPTPEVAAREAELDRVNQEREEKYMRMNKERRAAGLPELTRREKRLMLRNEIWELSRGNFAKLRQEASGRFETTELDASVDWERVRLSSLAFDICVKYPDSSHAIGPWPKSLHVLLDLKFPPGSDRPLLLGGDKDIQDQWGHEYRYRDGDIVRLAHGRCQPLITSAGPDGVFDTADDITSVDEFKLRDQKAERERKAKQRGGQALTVK